MTSPLRHDQTGSVASAMDQLTPSLGSAQVGAPREDLLAVLATALGIDQVTLTSAMRGVLNVAHRRNSPTRGAADTVGELAQREGLLAAWNSDMQGGESSVGSSLGRYSAIIADILRERQRQDTMYGSAHDDRLEWRHWKVLLANQLDKATADWQGWDVAGMKRHLVHLAATSLAVIDAIDRDGTPNALERSSLGS